MTLKKPTERFIIALVLGALMPLAFAPFNFWWVSVFAVSGLIFLWQFEQTKQQIFIIGLLFGLGYFGLGLYWVYFSLHDFGNAAVPVAVAITALLIMWQACYIGVLGLVFHQFNTRYSPRLALLLMPLLWFSMEWLKGIVITGLPWLSLGYPHINSPLSIYAPWLGVYGVGAISMLMSLVLVIVLKRCFKENLSLIIIAVFTLLLLPFLAPIEQTSPLSKSLKITQIQGNIAQEIKWQRDKRQHILDVYWDQTKRYWDSDLIVWPETAIPGRSEMIEESVLLPMSMIAAENETNLLFGVIVSDLAKSQYYNSMLMVGEHQGLYHKRHLVPFGEYMPMRWLLEFMNQFIQIPMSDMRAGGLDQPLMEINDVKLGVSICYEDVFSRDINRDLPDANILINTSNDAWFGDSLAPHQHLQIAQMRALETGRPMVRSTNTGISAFIDHKGKITQQTDQFKVQAITADVVGRTGETMFVTIQPYQWIIVLAMFLVLMASWVKLNKANSRAG